MAKQQFWLNVLVQRGERVVAVCDSGLLGRRFSSGEQVLDLDRYGAFYRGQLVGEEKVTEAFGGATSINLVGEGAVALAREAGLAQARTARKFAGVPMLQIVFME